LKKAKFHYEAAAMAGDEEARYNLGTMEAQSGNMERAVKHWTIAASAGHYDAMHNMLVAFNFRSMNSLRMSFIRGHMPVENQSTQLWQLTIVPVPR
jgi:TPR repeat protein